LNSPHIPVGGTYVDHLGVVECRLAESNAEPIHADGLIGRHRVEDTCVTGYHRHGPMAYLEARL
jgi:hypothetical protein